MRIIRALKVGLIVVTLLYVGSSAPKSIWLTAAIIGAWALVWTASLWLKQIRHAYERGARDIAIDAYCRGVQDTINDIEQINAKEDRPYRLGAD